MSDDRCDVLCLDLPRAKRLRAERLASADAVLIAARMRALADPTRLLIVDALARGGELCVCDLAWIVGRAQNLVSHHLRALRAARVAQSRREGKVVFYALSEDGARLYADAASSVAKAPVGAR
jgi:ArsR family transcriptional regulator, lead/cadmium/zinc/bismuth-responsive transcriptional repressor